MAAGEGSKASAAARLFLSAASLTRRNDEPGAGRRATCGPSKRRRSSPWRWRRLVRCGHGGLRELPGREPAGEVVEVGRLAGRDADGAEVGGGEGEHRGGVDHRGIGIGGGGEAREEASVDGGGSGGSERRSAVAGHGDVTEADAAQGHRPRRQRVGEDVPDEPVSFTSIAA
ncbi:hypothetical protein OsJ_00125 [Oryza sativa Japonica Group]|uniref:Uncharacterized protein n=1 Tax=Oryza sativa subsp. japonica TaxID=39947 RepID=A2ZNJ2_ORYSJ|nr:hypothetical protein OsJ_00125 [Oryza sativa Japonica Group]